MALPRMSSGEGEKGPERRRKRKKERRQKSNERRDKGQILTSHKKRKRIMYRISQSHLITICTRNLDL